MSKKLLIAAAIVAALSGCASVEMGDPAKDQALKSFQAEPSKAGIYVYRNESIGAAVKMDVAVDVANIGQTAANTYLFTQVAPGKHKITSKAENTDELEIDAKPGVLYYVWQEVKMGVLYARTKLHLMDESQGQSGVRETKLAAGK